MAVVPKHSAVKHSPRSVSAMPLPRARLWAASRADATLMPAVAKDTNTMYSAKINWYRPMPSPPRYAASTTRNPMPSARSTSPDPVSSAAFCR